MQNDEVKSKLTPIFRDIFRDDTLVIIERMTAQDVPAWDSLGHLNMIVAVEKAFGVKFSLRDFRSLKDVGDLIELIKKKVG
jgi:acyl carrier protein